ncbi:phosphatidate cytidylyltransferase [Yaniella halotolerans]|uniref:phosphatidate cytidylyltransferase n=1 Tax=Yaniella halotolerans TaxID=225453 RepID=UPI0003B6CBA2|nr:phosphatidate cytidylyltransferase [Yaniella halotolerans]
MSNSDPESEQLPVIQQLEGFPDPVRDPETGMIVPQTRRERRALEDAQATVIRRKAARQKQQHPQPEPTTDDKDVVETEDLDFGSDPAADLDPEESTILTVTQVDSEEGSTPQPQPASVAPTKESRAGRNLPAAITVGLLLLGAAVVGIFFYPIVVAILIAVLVPLGIWELAQVAKTKNIHLALTPALVAGLGIPIAAWFGGVDAMVFALFGGILLTVFWTAVGEPDRPAASMAMTLLAILWLPFFLSFGITLLHVEDGAWLVAITVLGIVASDTFGYLVGVTLGKHRMAPKISPKKSWEGFFGSLLGAIVVSVVVTHYWLEYDWWVGIIIGTVVMIAATAGDFAASMVKRDFGVKDMGNTLPGHGGVMDRLDSIVFAIPVGYTLFVVVLPTIMG